MSVQFLNSPGCARTVRWETVLCQLLSPASLKGFYLELPRVFKMHMCKGVFMWILCVGFDTLGDKSVRRAPEPDVNLSACLRNPLWVGRLLLHF